MLKNSSRKVERGDEWCDGASRRASLMGPLQHNCVKHRDVSVYWLKKKRKSAFNPLKERGKKMMVFFRILSVREGG